MPQPPDYVEDERYGGYARAEVHTGNGTVLKWVAGVLGSFTAAAMLLLVSCTYNKVDDLRGDVLVVKTKLDLKDAQYERDRRDIEARLSKLEQRGSWSSSTRERNAP